MSIPKIDPYPPAPTPEDDEATFDEKAYEHAASLEPRRIQMNEVATYVNTRASDANSRAVAAAASATASANSATRSDEWANKAPGSVVASGKYSARHYSDLSDKFANAPEDVEVEPGKFSALHWQEKAKKIADVHATTVATDPILTVTATNVQEALRDLAYQSDQLRVAKNQLKYGDGPYPVLDLQFQGAKILDPRITFTRASLDWDEDGNEYGIDEPVLTDQGLWVSRERTNLFRNSLTDQSITVTEQEYTISFYGVGSIDLYGAHTHTVSSSGERTTYTFTPASGQLNISPAGVEKVQLEIGAAATPYIPTGGSQVTVAPTLTQIAGDLFNDVYNPKQGTIYWEGYYKNFLLGSYPYLFTLQGGMGATLAVRISLNANALEVLQRGNASTYAGVAPLGGKLKIALTYESESFTLYVNGVLRASSPLDEGSTGFFDRIQLGHYSPGNVTMLHSNSLKYYSKALSGEQLQELTS